MNEEKSTAYIVTAYIVVAPSLQPRGSKIYAQVDPFTCRKREGGGK